MNSRIEIITQMAGIKAGQPVTDSQIELLVQIMLNDMLHYAHHVNSGKYDIKTAIARIDYLVKESYGIK